MVTHKDMNGHTSWEVYADAPQFANQVGLDGSRLIAEYRYTGSFTPPTGTATSPDATAWSERTVYVYDDGTTDPGTNYVLPTAEVTHLGRVARVQEWTKTGSTRTQTDFTDTQYDPATGQPSSITSNEGTINYTYDPASGRKVRMWTGTNSASAPDDTAYGYDSQGRLQDVYTLVLKGTRSATYTGINSTTHNPTFTGTPLTVGYTYDLAGNLKTESQPDQTTSTYTYDDLNRLTDLATQNTTANEPVFAEHYDLRADGLRSDVIDTRYNANGTTFSQTKVNWTYDGVDRLTSEALVVLAGGSNAPAAYTNVFKFDLASNRVEEDITGSQTATVTYTYNSDNELGVETRTGSGAYQTTDTYDTAGNLIGQVRTGASPETDSYAWDIRGRMKSATVSGTTTTYTYDSAGVRTSESTGTTHTYYLNDPNNPTGYTKAVEESATKGGTPSRSYIFGYSVEGQSDSTNGTLFLLHDGHGSTRALLNVTGGIVEQYNYDAYGTPLASTGAQSSSALAKTRWLFGGDGLYDPGSGWTYQLARYRNGFSFVSGDRTTIAPGNAANANLYVSVGANPVNRQDPTGELSLGELGFAGSFSYITFGVLTSPVVTVGLQVVGLATLVGFVANPDFRESIIAATGGDLTQLQGVFDGTITYFASKAIPRAEAAITAAFAARFAPAATEGASALVMDAAAMRSFFLARGLPQEVATGYASSFPNGIAVLREVKAGESFLRYSDEAGSTIGSFLTKISYGSPGEAVSALNLRPYNNGATLVQMVKATENTYVLEGGVAGGASTAYQAIAIDRNAFSYGPRVPSGRNP